MAGRDSTYWAWALAIVAAFAALKTAHLHLPYFWDELAVYAPAALHMHEHGLSLMPSSVPVDLSRGHPLLCAFTFAVGYRVLGPTPWAGHVVAMGIACCALLAAFGLGRAVAGRYAGLLGGLTLAIQPLFVAQAAQVLPEMLLAACCTAALWAHVTSRRAAYLMFASLAVLTKETAIVLPAGLVLSEVVLAGLRGVRKPGLVRRLGVSVLPLVPLAVFLAVQRAQHGWFMFPYHTGFLASSPWAVLDRAAFYLGCALLGQGRFVWLVVLGLALALVFARMGAARGVRQGARRVGARTVRRGSCLPVMPWPSSRSRS